MKRILLWDIPDLILLIVEHPSGVVYQNQTGGISCVQAELEGVLTVLEVSESGVQQIENQPYPQAAAGISGEIADAIDAVLAAEPQLQFLKVDRARLHQSGEAWVYVTIDAPEGSGVTIGGTYSGPIFGFGKAKGVLTWPNSD